MRKVLFAVMLIATLTWTIGAVAADLTIGTRTEPSIDPHFMYTTSNLNFSKHLFGMLVESDENGNPVPGLAESWKPVDEKTWEFKTAPCEMPRRQTVYRRRREILHRAHPHS